MELLDLSETSLREGEQKEPRVYPGDASCLGKTCLLIQKNHIASRMAIENINEITGSNQNQLEMNSGVQVEGTRRHFGKKDNLNKFSVYHLMVIKIIAMLSIQKEAVVVMVVTTMVIQRQRR